MSISQFVKRERYNKLGQKQFCKIKKYETKDGVEKEVWVTVPVTKKVGCFFAIKIGDKICIGISKAHRKDKFDPNMGLLIAKGKALDSLTNGVTIPHSFVKDFIQFKERCTIYFRYNALAINDQDTDDVNNTSRMTRNADDSDFVDIKIELTPYEQCKVSEKHLVKHD